MTENLKNNAYYKWAIFPLVIIIAIIESLWEGLKTTYNVAKNNFSEIKNTYF